MKKISCDVAVIGAGPAGLAAAIAAKENGAKDVLIIERDSYAGGILQQCIHPGFGLTYFREELTGPEYAERFIEKARQAGVHFLFSTTALEFKDNVLICVNGEGVLQIRAKAEVLAMGCRERTRANLVIPGSRPAGIYTAGAAQRLLNIQGHLVGKDIVILGSGDIGMIMARRLTLVGANIKAVVEILPYLAGLIRNKVQCLDDFGIPLLLSHTIVDITGIDRVESVTIAPVDENLKPIPENSQVIPCDTLLLSVGLIPENELSKTRGVPLSKTTKGALVDQYLQTEIPGLFSCGNVLHVNDLVDNVSGEGGRAGLNAARYAQGKLPIGESVGTIAGQGVRYVCPQRIALGGDEDVTLFFRVLAPDGKSIFSVEADGMELACRRVLRVSPGEMESVTIPAERIKKLGGDVTVSVKREVVK